MSKVRRSKYFNGNVIGKIRVRALQGTFTDGKGKASPIEFPATEYEFVAFDKENGLYLCEFLNEKERVLTIAEAMVEKVIYYEE
jgi:hypothetical protein